MSDDNWYDEGIGSVSFHEKTMKSYNAYTPPPLHEILGSDDKCETCPFVGSERCNNCPFMKGSKE